MKFLFWVESQMRTRRPKRTRAQVEIEDEIVKMSPSPRALRSLEMTRRLLRYTCSWLHYEDISSWAEPLLCRVRPFGFPLRAFLLSKEQKDKSGDYAHNGLMVDRSLTTLDSFFQFFGSILILLFQTLNRLCLLKSQKSQKQRNTR